MFKNYPTVLAFKRGNFTIKKIYFYSTPAKQSSVRLGSVLKVKKGHVQLGENPQVEYFHWYISAPKKFIRNVYNYIPGKMNQHVNSENLSSSLIIHSILIPCRLKQNTFPVNILAWWYPRKSLAKTCTSATVLENWKQGNHYGRYYKVLRGIVLIHSRHARDTVS